LVLVALLSLPAGVGAPPERARGDHPVVVLAASATGRVEGSARPRLTIINGSSEPAEVFWLKSPTERVPHGVIAPGQHLVIETTIGHAFAIVGRADQACEEVTSLVPVQAFRFAPVADAVAQASAESGAEIPAGQVIAPPAALGVPRFYAQFISAAGYPIVASERVNPYALREAAYLVDLMLAHRPDVRTAMIQSGSRLCILAHNEFTTDLPEFADLESPSEAAGLSAKDYWDARARGTGGSDIDPYCSCGEENLLGYPGDPYATENILIHEFAHSIHLRGMLNVDPTFDRRLRETYRQALAAGLWQGTYAAVDHTEYFAEGTQSWFNTNRENDHDHNQVDTRAELLEYDPALAAICREVYGESAPTYTRPATRLSGHLDGYDPTAAPTFSWPPRLQQAHAKLREAAQQRRAVAAPPDSGDEP
jgi:hypothetical protein